MSDARGGQNMALISAIVAVATIGGLLFGYDSGAVNGTQPGLKAALDLSEGGLGFSVGSLLIGCFIGAFFAGTLADQMGRRNVMRIAAVLFLVGALVQGMTDQHTLFVIARLAGGIAVGAASVLSPAYIAEVAPAHIRGRMTTVQQIMIITGLTLAFLVNYFLAAAAGVWERFHIRIELLEQQLSAKARRRLRIGIHALICVFGGIFLVYGAMLAWEVRVHVIPSLGISRGWAYIIIPLAGLLMSLFSLGRIYVRLTEKEQG